jgi:hypothetical protein
MAQGQISLKRIGVDKTNSRIVAITAAAAFLSVFFIVASISLFSQVMYQNRVIGKKRVAVKQLEANIKARDSLVDSYQAFVSAPQNILGGNPIGTGATDGSNAKIVLDALPSKYDFPALTTSIEKILREQGVRLDTLTGSDDEVNQAAAASTANPQPVEVPFEFTATSDFANTNKAVGALERSIRPIQIQKLQLSGGQSPNELKLNISAKTFYQPAKALTINEVTVE